MTVRNTGVSHPELVVVAVAVVVAAAVAAAVSVAVTVAAVVDLARSVLHSAAAGFHIHSRYEAGFHIHSRYEAGVGNMGNDTGVAGDTTAGAGGGADAEVNDNPPVLLTDHDISPTRLGILL